MSAERPKKYVIEGQLDIIFQHRGDFKYLVPRASKFYFLTENIIMISKLKCMIHFDAS